MMSPEKKIARYQRLYQQISDLLSTIDNPVSAMATIAAILHHKMDYFFWTGFYLLHHDALMVGPYQGSLACILLKKDTGVCWAGIRSKTPVIVDNVHEFPGHIACDSRSNSEIVIPVFNQNDEIVGVFDVDSEEKASFDTIDAQWLEKIIGLIYHK